MMSEDKNKKQFIDPEKMTSILDAIYAQVLKGIPKVTKPVDNIAAEYMTRYKNPDIASKKLVAMQIVKCGTSGFLTGLGGLLTLPVTIPANISSVLYVQMRMIAGIAAMGGYDVNSDQVQTLVYACLTGQAISDVLKGTGIKAGEKFALAAVKKIPGEVLKKINQKVGFRLVTKFGETGIVNIAKLVPVAGGIIGGGFDVVSTKIIAKNAQNLFIGKGNTVTETKKEDYIDVDFKEI